LPEDGFVVGALGRIVAIKDYPTLLHAAEELLTRGIDVHVLIVGSGPELAALRELVRASRQLSDRVVFTGVCDDIPGLLNTMDVFVLPSISEGMSNTLLEAMASGLPVVATDVGGNPEIVENERSGLLFRPGDVKALADRLARLAGDEMLRSELGNAARHRANETFSLGRMTENYTQLYLGLARQNGILNPQP